MMSCQLGLLLFPILYAGKCEMSNGFEPVEPDEATVLEKFAPNECNCPDDSSIFLSNKYVPHGYPNRALETLPDGFSIVKSKIPEAGLGVKSQMFIKKNTWLGEYDGEIVPVERKNAISWYAWQGRRGGFITHYIDAYNIDVSSWLRFINCARNRIEENVLVAECKGRFFYITKRDIPPGQELFVYYGHAYAERINIDSNLFA